MRLEAELVREMDRLWSPVRVPVLSKAEMRALAGVGSALVVVRARAGASVSIDARREVAAEKAKDGKIRARVAQLVTQTRVFLERTRSAVAGRVGTGLS